MKKEGIKKLIFFSFGLIFAGILILVVIKLKTNLLKRQFDLKPIQIEKTPDNASADNFNVIGTLKSLNQSENKITLKIGSGTKKLQPYLGKDYEFLIYDKAKFENKDHQVINLTDLKIKSKLMISGSIRDNKFISEKIEVL